MHAQINDFFGGESTTKVDFLDVLWRRIGILDFVLVNLDLDLFDFVESLQTEANVDHSLQRGSHGVGVIDVKS